MMREHNEAFWGAVMGGLGASALLNYNLPMAAVGFGYALLAYFYCRKWGSG